MKAVDKCKNCGATVEINENKRTVVCKYCGSRYILENDELTTPSTQQKATATETNKTNQKVAEQKIGNVVIPPRPKVNPFILVVGFMFYFFAGIIYLVYVKYKQLQWDQKYGKISKSTK